MPRPGNATRNARIERKGASSVVSSQTARHPVEMCVKRWVSRVSPGNPHNAAAVWNVMRPSRTASPGRSAASQRGHRAPRPIPAAPAPATSWSGVAPAHPAGDGPAAPRSPVAAVRAAPTGTVAVAGTALSPVARIVNAVSALALTAPACRRRADGARAMSIAAPATLARTATAPA